MKSNPRESLFPWVTEINLEKWFCRISEYERHSEAEKKGCIFNKRYYDELHLHENIKIFELFDNFSIDENDNLKIHVMLRCTFQQYLH